MGSTGFILMLLTILSKVTGLIREQVSAYYLGIGLLSDVYTSSTNIPFTIYGFILAGVGTSFIPIYNKIKMEQGEKAADRYTANLANVLFIVSVIVVAFIMLLAPYIIKLIYPGYSEAKVALTADFTRILSLATITSVVSSVYIAYLNLKGSFVIPAMTGMIMNFIHIITFVIAYKLNNFFVIAIGYVLADILKYALFPADLRRHHYKHKFTLDFKDPNIMLMIKMSVPIILSIAAVDLSTIIDQSLASAITAGTHGIVAALKNSILILQLVSGVIVVSIATVTYPKLSELATNHKNGALKRTMMESITFAQLLVYPATIGLMVLAHPTVKLLFERGNFDAQSTAIISELLFFYLPSLFGLAIRDLVIRGFYAQRDIRTAVKVTVVQEVIHIGLSLILSKIMGVSGLALATSISSILGGFLILYVFRKKYGRLNLKSFSIKTVKIIIASILMGIATHFIYLALAGKSVLMAFIVSILASIVIYGIIILFMNIQEVKKGVNLLYKKFAK